MKLFSIGATGRIGAHTLDLALARGHHVTAFVRSPQKIRPRERLRVVAGDPTRADALAEAIGGHDAVLSSLGPPARDALGPCTLMTDAGAALVAAMEHAGVRRVGIVSAAVLFAEPRGPVLSFFRWLLRHHAADLRGMEGALTASALEWTVARPPRLVEDAVETCRAVIDALPAGGSTCSNRAVAAFLLGCVERRDHVGDVVGIAR